VNWGKDLIIHHQSAGIINTMQFPDQMVDKLKAYSGWKVATVELSTSKIINKSQQISDTSHQHEGSDIDRNMKETSESMNCSN